MASKDYPYTASASGNAGRLNVRPITGASTGTDRLCQAGTYAPSLERFTGGVRTSQLRLCGNDRAFNDMWSLYNQLWSEALSYFTHPLLQMIYVQQAPMFKASQQSYETWRYFWQKQVLPVLHRQPAALRSNGTTVPLRYYQWWITRDMPFVLDRDVPPALNAVAPEWIEYVQCSFSAYTLRVAMESEGIRLPSRPARCP